MITFQNATFRYDPYPLGVVRPALEPDDYAALADTFPKPEIFGRIPKYDYKLSLSEKFNAEQYRRFIAETEPWRRFHAWIKSDAFIRAVVSVLEANNVDLDLDDCFASASKQFGRGLQSLSRGRLPSRAPRLRSRFEFSVLRAQGGEVAPHTDTPKKIITLVLSMIKDGEWLESFGGGLEVNKPTDPTYAFNWNNRIVPWDKIETIETIPFVPNQCIVFVKTFNSLHSVKKMNNDGSDALRKTVTIVIERDD